MSLPTDPPCASGSGIVRTEINCHNCNGLVIGRLNFDINGNHIIECPKCGHEHCRVIKDGVITGERWDGRLQRVDVEYRSTWKSNVIQAETSTTSAFIRELWLNRSDSNYD